VVKRNSKRANKWKCAHCQKIKRDIPGPNGFIFRCWTHDYLANGKANWDGEVQVCEECMDVEIVLDKTEW